MFSPYYAAMRRKGAADPTHHVAINLALYGVRGPSWCMTERGADALLQTETTLRIGPSQLAHQPDGSLLIRIDERAAPIPRRLVGQIRLTPRARFARAYGIDDSGRHHWTPLAPCATVSLDFARPGLAWSGHAYLDSNAGSAPLEADFTRWDWSRATLPDGGTIVLYDATRASGSRLALARHFHPDGTVTTLPMPPRATLPRGLWRMQRITHSETTARILHSYEDSPFYTRALVQTHLHGQPIQAVQESLSLTRFSQRWVQALLPYRMPR